MSCLICVTQQDDLLKEQIIKYTETRHSVKTGKKDKERNKRKGKQKQKQTQTNKN